MGITDLPDPVAGEWLADPSAWHGLQQRLAETVATHAAADPLAPGLPAEAARAAIGVPDRRLVEALARPPLVVSDGMVKVAERGVQPAGAGLPAPVAAAVRALRADLRAAPFLAPRGRAAPCARPRHPRAIAAAQRAGLLLRVSDQIVLGPDAGGAGRPHPRRLPQPFTTAQARRALGTTRRVAIPLLEYLDTAGSPSGCRTTAAGCVPPPGRPRLSPPGAPTATCRGRPGR